MVSLSDKCFNSSTIRRKLRILSHLLKKSLIEKFIFCAVIIQNYKKIIQQIFSEKHFWKP